jgi:hypothetical protein
MSQNTAFKLDEEWENTIDGVWHLFISDTIIVRGICGKTLSTINSIKKGSKLHEEWKDQISPQYATIFWNRITNNFLPRKLITLQKKEKKIKK